MRYFNFIIIALMTGLLLIACQETSTPLSQDGMDQTNESPVSLQKPTNSGPYVVRYEGNIFGDFLFIIDDRTGLALVLGVDVVALCSGTPNFDLVSIMEISVPEDANRIMQLIQGTDVQTSVWQTNANGGFNCGDVFNGTPLATGYSDLVNTDNDLFTFLNPTSVNHNAFGFTAHGQLTGPNGEQLSFSAHDRLVWDGVNGSSLRETNHIRLN